MAKIQRRLWLIFIIFFLLLSSSIVGGSGDSLHAVINLFRRKRFPLPWLLSTPTHWIYKLKNKDTEHVVNKSATWVVYSTSFIFGSFFFSNAASSDEMVFCCGWEFEAFVLLSIISFSSSSSSPHLHLLQNFRLTEWTVYVTAGVLVSSSDFLEAGVFFSAAEWKSEIGEHVVRWKRRRRRRLMIMRIGSTRS